MIHLMQQGSSAVVSVPSGPVELVFSGISQGMLSYRREGTSLVICFSGIGRDELVLEGWLDAANGMPVHDLHLDFGGSELVKLDAATLFSILMCVTANDELLHDGVAPL